MNNRVFFVVSGSAAAPFSSSIPDKFSEIALLKNLVSLDVSFNKLRRLPVSIDGCIHLKKLWLNRNRLSFLPRQVCFLKFLEELNVSSNK